MKADATEQDMIKLCKEAADHEFAMVAINPAQNTTLQGTLKGNQCTCRSCGIDPDRSKPPIAVKVFETQNAIENGADEIDYRNQYY